MALAKRFIFIQHKSNKSASVGYYGIFTAERLKFQGCGRGFIAISIMLVVCLFLQAYWLFQFPYWGSIQQRGSKTRIT